MMGIPKGGGLCRRRWDHEKRCRVPKWGRYIIICWNLEDSGKFELFHDDDDDDDGDGDGDGHDDDGHDGGDSGDSGDDDGSCLLARNLSRHPEA